MLILYPYGIVCMFRVAARPCGVPGDLPQVAVRVLKVGRVPTPKGVMSILYDDRSCLTGFLHDRIDFLLRGHVVSKREFSRA
jgi:hypothetical protein